MLTLVSVRAPEATMLLGSLPEFRLEQRYNAIAANFVLNQVAEPLTVVAQVAAAIEPGGDWPELRASLVGNDRPGIVREVSGVLSRHGLSIEVLNTRTVDAPMGGGRLFEADVIARIPPSADVVALRADLERLAAEILVGIALNEAD